MRKFLSLITVLVLWLCAGRSLAQTIAATPKSQTISCSSTATINVNSGGQQYFVTVNGGLIILDNGQEKNLLITNQPTITVRTASGAGKVYVSLANNPAVRDSVSVGVTPIALSSISGSTCISATGTATYSVTAVPGVSYLWRTGEGSPYTTIVSGGNTNSVTVQSVGTGNTLLRVYAFNDCTGELCAAPNQAIWIRKTFSVSQPDFVGPECIDASVLGNDSIVVYQVKPYLGLFSLNDYQWQYSSGLQRVYQSSDGSAISFKVTNASVDQSVTVTIGKTCNPGNVLTKILKAAPAVPVLTQSEYCFPTNQTTATFTIDPSYHKSGFVYQWLVPVNWAKIDSTATSITVSMDANAGNITIIAKNGLCGNTQKTFTVNRSINGAVVTGPACIAAGVITAVNYTISPLNNNSYTWTLPEGWTFQDALNKNGSSVWVIPDGIHGGNVTATTQGCGGTNTIPAYPITIGPATPGPITGSTCVEYGSTVTYSIAAVPNATSYVWGVPSGWGTPTVTNNGSTISITVSSGVTLGGIVKVRALGCGSTASLDRELQVAVGPPQPSAITGPTCVAQNADGVVFTIPVTPNATGYEWVTPSSWVYSTTDGGRTITVNGGITANATVSVRAKGCGTVVSQLRSLNITVGPGQPEDFTAGPKCVAPGLTGIVYTVPVLAGASSYEWVVPSGWTFTGNGSRSITISSNITTSGTVSVRGVGCSNITGPYRSVDVAVSPAQPGAITYYVGAPGNVCIGKGSNLAVTLSTAAVPDATEYTWTIPSGWSATTLKTTSPTNTILTDAASGGIVTVAASAGTCTGPAQSVTLARAGLEFCVAEATLFGSFHSFTVRNLPGSATSYNYRWYVPGVSGDLFNGSAYSQTVIDITGRPTIAVDISSASTPGCVTTQLISTGGIGTCPATLSVARANTASASLVTSENEPITAFPNPASQEVRIKIAGDVRDASGQIYSANGVLISSVKASGDFTLDVSNYKDGTYFILVKGTGGVAYTKFIVKH